MEDKEFDRRMKAVDQELKKRGLLPHQRPWHSLNLVDPGFSGIVLGAGADIVAANSGPYEGPNLFKAIYRWYDDMYGERMKGPGPISRFPIMIRSEIYLSLIPLVFGRVEVSIQASLKDVTQTLFSDLSDSELSNVYLRWREGYELEYELWAARNRDYLPENALLDLPGVSELLQSGFQDRDAALDALTKPSQYPIALFHCQQLAEKGMKAVLRSSGFSEKKLKKIGHDLVRLHRECFQKYPVFGTVTYEARSLSSIGMNVRYDNPVIYSHQAVGAYWAGLRVAALCTCIICRINRRVIKGVKAQDSKEPIQLVEGFMTYREL